MSLALVLGMAGTAFAQPGEALLRADLPYQAETSDEITHDVQFVVTVTPPAGCKVLRVWLPLPQSDPAQQITEGELSTFPLDVTPQINTESVYGNKFAYFEFVSPQGAQIIRHTFSARISQQNWNIDPAKVQTVTSWPASFDAYLRPEHVNAETEFNEVLASISSQSDQAAGMNRLLGAMEWVDTHMTYSHDDASLKADPNHAFDLRRGHCSDYHGLCATMGRALGFPTRVTYGLALVPKSSPSHCKLEAFIPPYGWVSFDLSETQKLIEAIGKNEQLSPAEKEQFAQAARDRLHAGFRENSWLLLTRGTDYELAPKAAHRVRVVRTIYAEADGEPLPDPDPSSTQQHTFAWMTAHKYTADKDFTLPFKDLGTLRNRDQGPEVRDQE